MELGEGRGWLGGRDEGTALMLGWLEYTGFTEAALDRIERVGFSRAYVHDYYHQTRVVQTSRM